MKELRSKFLSLLRYVPYIIDENPKIQRFLSCLPLVSKIGLSLIIRKLWRKLSKRLISVMNRVRREKVYLNRRIRRQVTLTRKEEGLSQIRVLGINLRISITIREQILKIKYGIILQHQKTGICLTTLLKIMNKRNLSNVGNVRDRIMPSTV